MDGILPAVSKSQMRRLLAANWQRHNVSNEIQEYELFKRRTKYGVEYLFMPFGMLMMPDGVVEVRGMDGKFN